MTADMALARSDATIVLANELTVVQAQRLHRLASRLDLATSLVQAVYMRNNHSPRRL